MDLDLLSSLESIDLVSIVDDGDLGLILAFLSFGLGAAQWFAGEKDCGDKLFSDIYAWLCAPSFALGMLLSFCIVKFLGLSFDVWVSSLFWDNFAQYAVALFLLSLIGAYCYTARGYRLLVAMYCFAMVAIGLVSGYMVMILAIDRFDSGADDAMKWVTLSLAVPCFLVVCWVASKLFTARVRKVVVHVAFFHGPLRSSYYWGFVFALTVCLLGTGALGANQLAIMNSPALPLAKKSATSSDGTCVARYYNCALLAVCEKYEYVGGKKVTYNNQFGKDRVRVGFAGMDESGNLSSEASSQYENVKQRRARAEELGENCAVYCLDSGVVKSATYYRMRDGEKQWVEHSYLDKTGNEICQYMHYFDADERLIKFDEMYTVSGADGANVMTKAYRQNGELISICLVGFENGWSPKTIVFFHADGSFWEMQEKQGNSWTHVDVESADGFKFNYPSGMSSDASDFIKDKTGLPSSLIDSFR